MMWHAVFVVALYVARWNFECINPPTHEKEHLRRSFNSLNVMLGYLCEKSYIAGVGLNVCEHAERLGAILKDRCHHTVTWVSTVER